MSALARRSPAGQRPGYRVPDSARGCGARGWGARAGPGRAARGGGAGSPGQATWKAALQEESHSTSITRDWFLGGGNLCRFLYPCPKVSKLSCCRAPAPGRLSLHCSPRGMSWDFSIVVWGNLPWVWSFGGARMFCGSHCKEVVRGWQLGSPFSFCIRFESAVPRGGGAAARAGDNGRLMGRPSRLRRPRESGDPGPAGLALGEGAAGKGGAVWVG